MRAIKLLTSRFIGGSNNEEVFQTIEKLRMRGWQPIIDFAKEGSKNMNDVVAYSKQLKSTIEFMNNNFHKGQLTYALKVSSFAPSSHDSKIKEMITYMLRKNVDKVFLDAECLNERKIEDQLFYPLLETYNRQQVKVYKTYQMYRKDSMQELQRDIKRFDYLGVKMVRGAYHQQDKSSGLLYTRLQDTHKNYDSAAEYMLSIIDKKPNINCIFATHNSESILKILSSKPSSKHVAFAQLMGMRDDLSDALVKHGYNVYKYVPYGNFRETMPYLIRRLYENYDLAKYML